MTADECRAAVAVMSDAAEELGGDCNDENSVVRDVVYRFRGRDDFYAWFCVCCELADRASKRRGFSGAVDEAFTKATEAIEKRRNGS